MLVLKVCIGAWENESRDKRELAVCEELGCTTAVLAKGNPGDKGREDSVAGYKVYRYTTRPLSSKLPNGINRFFSLFAWARFVRSSIRPDVISGHNLSGLLVGWISNWFRGKHKAKLVYDSHEFELGLEDNKPVLKNRMVMLLERLMISKSSLVLMVSDSIADEVSRIHRLKTRPTVVRNVPARWDLDYEKAVAVRNDLLSNVTDARESFVVMYHGGILKNRGIEQLISAVALVPNVVLIILGNGGNEYVRQLKDLCENSGILNRVVFHDAVDLKELPNYVASADIGVSLLLPTAVNHLYALPNKFFENIQCLNPIIVSDFPEMGKIVDEYDIGIKVNPDDSKDIAKAICVLSQDKSLFENCKANLMKAKVDLCWENEKNKLLEAYERILT